MISTLILSFISVTCVLSTSIYQSIPFDPFRIECPKSHGVVELTMRMVASSGGRRNDILFTTACDNIDDMFPITDARALQQLNHIPEREDCHWSGATFDPFNDDTLEKTCSNREYIAGVSRIVTTRVQFLCCKLRTRDLRDCRSYVYQKPTRSNPLVQLHKRNSLIASLEIENDRYNVRFCDVELRDMEEIENDIPTTTSTTTTTTTTTSTTPTTTTETTTSTTPEPTTTTEPPPTTSTLPPKPVILVTRPRRRPVIRPAPSSRPVIETVKIPTTTETLPLPQTTERLPPPQTTETLPPPPTTSSDFGYTDDYEYIYYEDYTLFTTEPSTTDKVEISIVDYETTRTTEQKTRRPDPPSTEPAETPTTTTSKPSPKTTARPPPKTTTLQVIESGDPLFPPGLEKIRPPTEFTALDPPGLDKLFPPGHLTPPGTESLLPPGNLRPPGVQNVDPPGHLRPPSVENVTPPGNLRPPGVENVVPPGHLSPPGTDNISPPSHLEPPGLENLTPTFVEEQFTTSTPEETLPPGFVELPNVPGVNFEAGADIVFPTFDDEMPHGQNFMEADPNKMMHASFMDFSHEESAEIETKQDPTVPVQQVQTIAQTTTTKKVTKPATTTKQVTKPATTTKIDTTKQTTKQEVQTTTAENGQDTIGIVIFDSRLKEENAGGARTSRQPLPQTTEQKQTAQPVATQPLQRQTALPVQQPVATHPVQPQTVQLATPGIPPPPVEITQEPTTAEWVVSVCTKDIAAVDHHGLVIACGLEEDIWQPNHCPVSTDCFRAIDSTYRLCCHIF